MPQSQDKQADIKDKHGEPIREGDAVWTKMRGGRHEGAVDAVVTSEAEAREEGVKNPPKVLFKDQHGHGVAHNPGTLERKE
ncbi:Uu.00g138780.m01.CDS01 [Anthostomella pinea]|uniref:Uu.00g138780.m01.CDS01 n=1 Tax=Anthostomella pinea TaxID=933095 RepID=A0AAI8YL72_9PEZI|nr:Uu.00g138780.m01.CDS01 [Anthostomella pinea]